jgi:argininosuccinate lyase
LVNALEHLMNKHKNDTMPGYTHLQQAQPITLGNYFGAYCAMFKRDLSRLDDWCVRMNFSPLGAGALAGSSLPLDRKSVADELMFDGIIEKTHSMR